jgi:uncharacterized DUF497 family protein
MANWRELVYNVHEGGDLEFEWDARKAESNLRRHGVEFLDAVVVLDDDRAITLPDAHPGEERYLTFGMDAQGRVLAVSTRFVEALFA